MLILTCLGSCGMAMLVLCIKPSTLLYLVFFFFSYNELMVRLKFLIFFIFESIVVFIFQNIFHSKIN